MTPYKWKWKIYNKMRRIWLRYRSCTFPRTRWWDLSTNRVHLSFHNTTGTKLWRPQQRTPCHCPMLQDMAIIPLRIFLTPQRLLRPWKPYIFSTSPRPHQTTSSMDHILTRLQLQDLPSKRIIEQESWPIISTSWTQWRRWRQQECSWTPWCAFCPDPNSSWKSRRNHLITS